MDPPRETITVRRPAVRGMWRSSTTAWTAEPAGEGAAQMAGVHHVVDGRHRWCAQEGLQEEGQHCEQMARRTSMW